MSELEEMVNTISSAVRKDMWRAVDPAMKVHHLNLLNKELKDLFPFVYCDSHCVAHSLMGQSHLLSNSP